MSCIFVDAVLPPSCPSIFFLQAFSNLHLFACQNHGLSPPILSPCSPGAVLLHVPISQAGPGLATWHGTTLRLKMPVLLSNWHPDETSPSFGRPALFGDASQAIFYISLSKQWGHNAACGTDWSMVDDTTCCMIPPADPILSTRFDAELSPSRPSRW